MLLFFVFLSFVIGLSSYIISPFILLSAVPVLGIYYLRFREWKEIGILLFSVAMGALVSFLFPKGNMDAAELIGICIKRKENYCEFLSLSGKYYIYDEGKSLVWLEIAKIKGSASSLSFSHYESGFDFGSYLESEGIFTQFDITSKESYFSFDFLTSFESYTFSFLDEKSRIIADSFLFGGSLSELEEYEALTALSLSSALAVSGFHLAFLLEMIRKILGRKYEKQYEIIELLIILVFVILSGFRYSMRRILLLKAISMICRKRDLRLSFLSRVSAVGIIMLFSEPYSVLSSSFLYSFPFLVFMAFFQNKTAKNWKSAIGFMLLIYAFYLPFRLVQNYQFSVLSLPVSLIMMPMSHLIFLVSVLLPVIPFIGVVINPLCSLYLSFVSIAYDVSPIWITGMPSVIFVVLFYLILIIIQYMKLFNYRKIIYKACIALAIFSSTTLIPDCLPHYEVTFIDVDQGDSTLVRYGNTNLLIDTGGKKKTDLAVKCLIPYFHKRKIRKLDAVIITHLDYDHYGALESLNANFTIDNIYYASDFLESEDYTIAVNDLPICNLNDIETDDSNTGSGVYSFAIRGKKILIMGDASIEAESYLLGKGADVDADIIKIGHHGSKTSSSKDFLSEVSPELAIISCGENNSYGHPHQETLDTLEELSIPYRRTDQEGTIQLLL